MSKKTKKIKTVAEAVGDTSGFDDVAPAFDKKRKITLFAGLAGIVVLIVVAIIFFTTPVKAEFIFQDGSTKAERFEINRQTNTITEGPKDPKRTCYEFGGWYFDPECKNGGLFNNDKDDSLLTYEFKSGKKVSLYAKWVATEYKITYDVKGNANINKDRVGKLEDANALVNPLTYTIKHTLSEHERISYIEYLREKDPDKYVNSSDAQKNLARELEYYSNEAQKSIIKLQPLTLDGWTFVGWFDEEGKQVTELDKLDPHEITLTARWEQN